MSYLDEDLVRKLQTYEASGADVHTRNKARAYYVWAKLGQARRSKLETLIRKALATGYWGDLKQYMRRWY